MQEKIFLKHKLKRYNNREEYLIDTQLRAFLLEILEHIENSLKQSFINTVGENYDNLNFYRERFRKEVDSFIEEKTEFLIRKDDECKIIVGKIEVNLFISKLTFGEISHLFRKLDIKYKKIILKDFGFYKLKFFEGWISNIRYLRNLVCHGENIFNRKYEKKIDFYDTKENNNNFKGYFLILGVFSKILGIENKLIEIGKFLQKEKDAPGVKHISKEIEAWYVLVNTLYDFYVKKSNLNGEKIKIHIYTQYYFPVSNACSNRIEKYVLALKDDYDIKIITGMPNYPTGIKEKKYKWRLLIKEIGQYAEKIIRTYEIATKNEGTISRLLNYTSFMLSSFLYGLFTKKPDIIIVTSPPLFTAIGVLLLHKIRKIPYILEIRDLWPESVVALGYMKKNSLSYKIFHYLEFSLYKNASKIIGVTKGIVDDIEKMGEFKDKLFLQYNIFNLKNKLNFSNEEKQNIIKKYNIDKNKKIFVYAGNHSEAQNLFNILYLARDYKNGFFYFLGDGESKLQLEKYCKENAINNVYFLGQQDKKIVYLFLEIADFALASLKDNELFNNAIPTKILEYLAFNKKVIVFIKGDLAEKIKKYKLGIVSDNYNKNLIKEIDNFEITNKIGEDLINDYFSFSNFVNNIKKIINLGKK